jgi:hypothetical protein
MSFLDGIVKSLVNPMSLAQLAMGPAGWASLAMKTIGTAIAQQVIQKLGQELGLPQGLINLAQQGFAAASGQPGAQIQSIPQAAAQLGEMMNFSPKQQGELTRSSQDAADDMVKFIMKSNAGAFDEDGQRVNGKSSKSDFFTMFAKAMGAKLDQGFRDIAAKSDSTKWTDSKAVSDFQAEQQKFNFFMTSVSTAIKTVGEALAGMARKQ